ncbi:hypothetical protein KA017_03640 [Candidatus Woesebacteria bacterium]|nr:hypothetical protein [Candidatus Woesebacteria bacterium]
MLTHQPEDEQTLASRQTETVATPLINNLDIIGYFNLQPGEFVVYETEQALVSAENRSELPYNDLLFRGQLKNKKDRSRAQKELQNPDAQFVANIANQQQQRLANLIEQL